MPWFQRSAGRAEGSAARDRYIFRDGLGPDGAAAAVGLVVALRRPGLAQSRRRAVVPASVRPEQPDLNWDNREVRDDFLTTLRFWADRGVGRLPGRRRARSGQGSHRARCVGATLPKSHPPTATILCGIATRCTRSTPSGAGCSTSTTHHARRSPRPGFTIRAAARYASPQGLGQAFNFDLLEADWDPGAYPKDDRAQPGHDRRSGASSDLGALATTTSSGVRHPLRAAANIRTARSTRRETWLLTGGTPSGGRREPSACGGPGPHRC